MAKGDISKDQTFRYTDSYSGREIIRLTDHLGHSSHLYFTDPCWLQDNRSFIFASDRQNATNLYSYHLDSAEIRQLTDLKRDGGERPAGCFSQVANCHYFWWRGQLIELDVDTLVERTVYEVPAGMTATDARPGVTSDAKYVCTRIMEELKSSGVDFAYSHFRDRFNAKPFCQILRIEIATGKAEIIHEDRCYITHENASPTLPDIMTFCHEGPWDLVGQRIWGLNIQTGETWKIRSQEGLNIAIGHEYWFDDGIHIGYHGRFTDGGEHHIYGRCKWDNSDLVEVDFPYHSTHFCSKNENLIVGDGTAAAVFSQQGDAEPFIQLFSWDGQRYENPRVLAYHRSTFNDQHAHCHPRFTPDGKYVMYSSDLNRYANIYLVEVGDVASLPLLSELESPKHT